MNAIAVNQNKNPYEIASDLMGGAGNTFGDIASEGVFGNINDYVNPYYEQVLDRVLGRMGTQHNQQLNAIGDSAQSAGAFGGSRHGVMEGIAAGEYNKNVGDVTAQLRQEAFNNATGMAATDAASRMGAASSLTQLGGQYFNVGNMVADRQQQQGTLQQQLLQAILGGGQQQFSDMMQQPYDIINMFSALLSADPRAAQSQGTQTTTPGLYDYLSLGAQTAGKVATMGAA